MGGEVSPKRSIGFSERREIKASVSSKGDEGRVQVNFTVSVRNGKDTIS